MLYGGTYQGHMRGALEGRRAPSADWLREGKAKSGSESGRSNMIHLAQSHLVSRVTPRAKEFKFQR